ncbi:MAG: ATP-dependent DNA helicase [Alphaproteobacteria bacterium]
MAVEFAAIEWGAGADEGLWLARFDREGMEEAAPVSDEAQLRGAGLIWCFRPEDLPAEWHGAWRNLEAAGHALDGRLLGRVVFPMSSSHDHASLARLLAMSGEWSDGAERAKSAAAVARGLIEALDAQPLAALLEMEKLLKPVRHPLRRVVADAAGRALKKGFGAAQRELADLFPEEAAVFARRRRAAKEPPTPLDAGRLCEVFAPGGSLARSYSRYEYRPEQVRMVQEVCEAFNEGLALMVEAGTGTGKSLAYLVPAIAWAVANDDPVVISTNTKNLQGQLFRKDLPFLERAWGRGFSYALIKGRANYLCLRRFMMLLRAADRELGDGERLELLPIVTWLSLTKTGDVAENGGFRPGMRSELWSLISTQRDECAGPRCRWRRRCFVQRARARARQADIVVANHATVFVESGDESVALPEHRCVVFDEAHNLEDVATNTMAVVVGPWQAPMALRRLFQSRRDGAGRGLLASLRFLLSKAAGSVAGETPKLLGRLIETAIGDFPSVRRAGDALFARTEGLFEERRQGDRIRYDADHRPEDWPQVAQAIGEYGDALGALAKKLEAIAVEVGEAAGADDPEEPLQSLLETGADVEGQAIRLRELAQALQVVLKADDETQVYWAEYDRARGAATLNAAPLDIAEKMDEMIYSRSRTVVFTSATLAAAGSFDFMRDRLGLRGPVAGRVRTSALGSSFDFARQALVAVPLFLPEPRRYGPDFVKPFTELAAASLRAVGGRGLVLFTSHGMLREAAGILKKELAGGAIRVLAQGIDGGREHLLAVFAQDTSSVLLGTQSFWEGVDVPGESLTCLIVAKLPFRPHTDPIVSARCELLERRGQNAFMEYMVPDAVIRLKQGFGRLIRSRKDRGVVLICDPRMMTKRYGRVFRDSLPAEVKAISRAQEWLDALRDFLGGKAEG